jgi:hypothetical protein
LGAASQLRAGSTNKPAAIDAGPQASMLMLSFYRNLTASNVRLPLFDPAQAAAAIMGVIGALTRNLRECTKF